MTRRPPRSRPFPYTTLFRSMALANVLNKTKALVLVLFQHETLRLGEALATYSQARAACLHLLHGGGIEEEHDIHGFRVSFATDRKSTRLNSSHVKISYAVFC